MKIKIVQFVIALNFLLLALAIFSLQVIQGSKYRQLSEANYIRVIVQKGSRGPILDRNHQTIADSRISFNVTILPKAAVDLDKIFSRLGDILGVSAREISDKFRQRIIANSLPVSVADNIERQQAILIEEVKFELPGVMIQIVPQRSYPYGKLAAHLLGYLGEIDHWRLTKLKDYGYKTKDTVGYTGIEERYDYYLRPEDGGLQLEVDYRNRVLSVLGLKSPSNGKEIQLTIDLKLQQIVESSLEDKTGAVVVLDPQNGEVLAMASAPDFYPSWFIKKSPPLAALLSDIDAPLLNRAVAGRYPAGSIFKVVVASAGLQTKKINYQKTFFCNGVMKLGKGSFACWDKHASQNLIEAITHSCNVFFYHLGLLLGPDRLNEYAFKFGLGRMTQIDLPEETDGFVPSPLWKRMNQFRSWFDGDTANFAIGQGELLVTPLQIVRMISVFANDGNLVKPYLVKGIDGKDVRHYQRKVTHLDLDKRTLELINQGLRAVVSDPAGTAHILWFEKVAVAGKTGTAQVAGRQPHGWFAGYFPQDKPRFAICVFLEHGGSGFNACLVTKNIIEKMQEAGLL